MSAQDSSSSREGPARTAPPILPKLAIIGVLLIGIVVSFAYVAGWLSTGLLTPSRFADGFEEASGGIHSGFRRNHAKGVCIGGFFDSNGNGGRISKADVFPLGRVPVIGRFSLSGGDPDQADSPATVRGLGLAFRPEHGEEWRTAMVNLPVFIARTPQGFYDHLMATKPDPATGQPDPAKMKAFLDAHPETGRAFGIIKSQPFSSGFDNAAYHSLNAFRVVNAEGTAGFVRWEIAPIDEFKPADSAEGAKTNKNYLFDNVIARIHQGPVQWKLILTLAQPGDPTNDATLPWPSDREHIDTGTLTIDRIEGEAEGACRDVNFDPLVLPNGIEPSDDPLLSARSAVYSQSFTRREGEKKSPSAITTGDNSGKGM